ncbi:tetratricopeptide repeat protein [Telluribacter sp. SYSU D00476]|uniref:tetratricopeptide repeat protein n=1 Tax=Telluribacter sp. SYSU D00476 TaxID=2811430 RepID=UPI001FF49395|nr:hypothetical protein [Telluribacter sp. SYSU D00476]
MNERIEHYFNRQLPPTEQEQFEKELLHNPQLAEEVALYLSVKEALRAEILAERHAEWQQLAPPPARSQHPGRVVPLRPWYYSAAAVLVLAIGLVWFWLSSLTPDVHQMADAYVEENLASLSVPMDTEMDSLTSAIHSYNDGDYATARAKGQAILQKNASNADALNLLGVIALRQKEYEQAITYFHRLAAIPDLTANPGTFYEALAYIQRGQPSDLAKAKQLLQTVIAQDMDGAAEAKKWLAEMEDN